MRYLGLDIGEKRIGVALSESGLFAQPHSILSRKSKQEDFTRIGNLVAELNIDCVVVGMPYSLSGADPVGPQARRIKRYSERLAKTLTVPIEYFDERYSTADAKLYRAAMNPKSSKANKPIDDAAAAVILQNYLDAQGQNSS